MTARRQADLLSIQTLHEGWGRYLLASIRLPDGQEIRREIEDHGRAVAVLPYDPERRTVLLVRLLRNGPLLAGVEDPFLLEAPAGMIDEGSAEAAARREALEEVGVRLQALEPLGAPFSCPGVSTERIDLFLAPYAAADRVGDGGGLAEEHEDIEVVEAPLADFWRLIEAGEIIDLKTLALGLMLRVRRPELFA